MGRGHGVVPALRAGSDGHRSCNTFWKQRNVWTYDPVNKKMVKIQVDAATGTIVNKAEPRALGLTATDAESDAAARWLLGDPRMNNPAVLGALANSTAIDIGPPQTNTSKAPGAQQCYDANANRPQLTYIVSSSGMLHAFCTRAQTVGGTTCPGGKEAFAFIPPSLLPRITQLYVQNGQLPGSARARVRRGQLGEGQGRVRGVLRWAERHPGVEVPASADRGVRRAGAAHAGRHIARELVRVPQRHDGSTGVRALDQPGRGRLASRYGDPAQPDQGVTS